MCIPVNCAKEVEEELLIGYNILKSGEQVLKKGVCSIICQERVKQNDHRITLRTGGQSFR